MYHSFFFLTWCPVLACSTAVSASTACLAPSSSCKDQRSKSHFGSEHFSKQQAVSVRVKYCCNYMMHRCDECQYSSDKLFLLRRHLISHSTERPYPCSECPTQFKTKVSLSNHLNTHFGIKPHRCGHCEKQFTTSGVKVRHERSLHTNERRHQCPLCDYKSVELSKLRRHRRVHTGERPYQCPQCSSAFADTFKLQRHMRVHTGEKPYQCSHCEKSFSQSNSLKSHVKIHTNQKEVIPCSLCDSTFGRKTDLTLHMGKLHSNDGSYFCQCGLQLPDRYSLKVHKRSHRGEKYLKCGQCSYTTSVRKHLDSHYLVHTGLKPFPCSVVKCGQTFRQKQLLARHQRLHHDPGYVPPPPGDKPWACPQCVKTFRREGNLVRHLDDTHGIVEHQHDRKRKRECFDCDLCHESFTSLHYLRKHQRSHTERDDESSTLTLQHSDDTRLGRANFVRETKRSRKNLLKIKERIAAGISPDVDDDIQIWDGEEYVAVEVGVDQTVLQWENDGDTLLDTELLFTDPGFGWLGCSEGQHQTRRSVGFRQSLRHRPLTVKLHTF